MSERGPAATLSLPHSGLGACRLPVPEALLRPRSCWGWGDRRRQETPGTTCLWGTWSGRPSFGCGHLCRAGVQSGLLGWACLPGYGAPPTPGRSRSPPGRPAPHMPSPGQEATQSLLVGASSPEARLEKHLLLLAPAPPPGGPRDRCYQRNASRAQRPGNFETAPSGPVTGDGPAGPRSQAPEPQWSALCGARPPAPLHRPVSSAGTFAARRRWGRASSGTS